MAEQKNPRLTTSAGAPVGNNQNSLTAGKRGPVVLQDYKLFEKIAHQNRERIPERVVHAKGWADTVLLLLPMTLLSTPALNYFLKLASKPLF